jgi:hypothetical protein
MATKTLSSKQYIGKLQLIYAALLAGHLIFLIGVVVLKIAGIIEFKEYFFSKVLLLLIPALVLVVIILDKYLSITNLFKIKPNHSLNHKLIKYRAGYILKLMFYELPSLSASFAFFFTGNYIYLGILVITVLLFIFKRTDSGVINKELNLNEEEQNLMNDPDAIVGEFETES